MGNDLRGFVIAVAATVVGAVLAEIAKNELKQKGLIQ